MKYTLNDGHTIPALGFGTWQTPDGDIAYQAVLTALEAGYRHIDTAAIYGNEVSVGKALKDSGIPREEIFLTTKLWNDAHGYEEAKQALKDSMQRLGVDYLDLYLIHWPNPSRLQGHWQAPNADAWRAMEEAKQDGLIRSIGVSNFMIHHLEELLKTAVIIPAVNQIYLSPSDQQEELVKFCQANNILCQAYSPLGTGTILESPELIALAEKYARTAAQIAIRWSLQKGFNPLPKSVTDTRIIENFKVFDFKLSDEDMAVIDTFKGIGKTAPDPDRLRF